ncbi:RcnB family protein [Sphingomonas prati]|uniref:Ni/Co efflux regulator RcnB n=1 Tax=Sphingomonas prati TaxID=1843237 RepID=A0A7W9F336_9SPHN|nr:RcnB family protein [Sphingomonas prati]MBB5729095.1 Ni/Co efflux regulator RcnB [Sphingomonas prati]GGE85170.1 hypothetical protein GCM10011404_17380 [Sphingomonas prati]
MKKFIIALLAATIATGPVAAAPDRQNDGRGRVEQRDQRRTVVVKKTVVRQDRRATPQKDRRWAKGQRFESRYARNYRVIQTPRQYRLSAAPRGYRWVQSGNDAVLIGITSGIIAAVSANVIR